MFIQTQVPVRNRKGKGITLRLDTTTGRCAVAVPTMFRLPQVTLDDLHAAVAELQRLDGERKA